MGMIARKAMDAGQVSQNAPKYGHLRPFFPTGRLPPGRSWLTDPGGPDRRAAFDHFTRFGAMIVQLD
jgi:hypothetical protein